MPKAFVSYVQADSATVERVAGVLREFEVEVWLDRTTLKPGLRWQDQIRQGIAEGDFFLACFSRAYLQKRKTYMNTELTLAIDELRERPTNRAWFIPLRLDSSEIPDRSIGGGETLRSIQWIDMFADWTTGIERLLSVLVPGSERIPNLIAQLGSKSARKRIEAIEALGRLGTVARSAIPKLLERIPIESKTPLGLSPLAAINDSLAKIGYVDPTAYAEIHAQFDASGIDMGAAAPPD